MNMIERVGMVIMRVDGCGLTNDAGDRVFCNDLSVPEDHRGNCECLSTARAAIEAMKEPTESMEIEGDNHADRSAVVWTAMISQALKEGGE